MLKKGGGNEMSKLSQEIDEIRKHQKKVNESAKDSEDVKSGKCTKEEELQEPGYVLYNHITECTVNILQSPTVEAAFDMLSKKLGDEATKALIDVFAISMTNSAHQAVLFYDELLKKELTKSFDSVGHHLNLAKADIQAHSGAIDVFRKRLDDIDKTINVNKLKKDNGIS